jgi:acyl carrier protein
MGEVNGIHPCIRSFILDKFPAAKKRLISDDLSLLESGIVDSLGVLDVVGFLEQTFKIKVEDDELTPDNFSSIRCLVSFVATKVAEAGVLPAK